METTQKEKVTKIKASTVSTVSLRMKRETKRRVLVELAKVNKKSFGKKVRVDELICLLLPLLTDAHIKSMQDSSMTNADRLELQYRDYIKTHGAISKDDFLGQILIGKISNTL